MTSIDLDVEKFSKREGSRNQTEEIDEETLSVYDEKELHYLDKYLPMEDELYQIILNCDFNDEKIEKTIKDRLKFLNAKGLEYGWNIIDKNHRKKPVDFSHVVKADDIPKGEKNKKVKNETKNRKKQNKSKTKSQILVNDRVNYVDNFNGYYSQSYEYENYFSNYYQSKGGNSVNNYSDYYGGDNRQYNSNAQSRRSNKYYYNDYNNYYSYDNREYSYNSYYNYYDSYYYNQGYNNNKYGTKSFKRKKRPNLEKYNYRNKTENYYDMNFNDYSTKYDGNNKNYRVIIKDLGDDEQIIRTSVISPNKDYIDVRKEGNNEVRTEIEDNPNNQNEDNPSAEVKENVKDNEIKISEDLNVKQENEIITHNKNQNVENFQANAESNFNTQSVEIVNYPVDKTEKINLNSEVSNEIEEINVNKVDIENLRSYFDKFKHFTIFNETVQPSINTIPEKKSSKPFYDQFSNFKSSSAMIKSFMNSNNASINLFEKQTDKESGKNFTGHSESREKTNSKPKKPNMLSINNNDALEITSNASKIESDFEDKKIYNFSLFISGTEKSKKPEEPTINKNPSQENKSINSNQPITQPISQPLNQPITQPPHLTLHTQSQIPNHFMYYPNYTNMVNSQPINSYIPYEQPGFINMPNRMNYAESGHYNPEFIGNNPTDPYQSYEYANQYYGMPYRFNSIQYPGYQNFQYGAYPSGYMDRYPYMSANVSDYNYSTFPNYPMNTNPNMNYAPYNEQQKRK